MCVEYLSHCYGCDVSVREWGGVGVRGWTLEVSGDLRIEEDVLRVDKL